MSKLQEPDDVQPQPQIGEAPMFRDQMINFLQAVVVFLLMTNAFSAVAALYAMWLANGSAHNRQELSNAIGRKVHSMLRRVS